MEKVSITTPYIKLGQFLKFVNLISSGGEEKIFILTTPIHVNNEKENRRGRKLYVGDIIEVSGKTFIIE